MKQQIRGFARGEPHIDGIYEQIGTITNAEFGLRDFERQACKATDIGDADCSGIVGTIRVCIESEMGGATTARAMSFAG